MTTRTRFAPSPTGFLHVGGIRTALFAYLVAKQQGGQFVMRLEDTDQNREVIGSREHLIASLLALGLDFDEGPGKGGNFGPYVQSERLDIYKHWANYLIEQGRAYVDPYSPEELQLFREQDQKAKRAFLYRNYRPDNPPVWDGTMPLRFKSEPKSYTYVDKVMGEVTTDSGVVDDFILIKSDGYPTYNFAHIIDDMLMEITHVIRGQEFISSMPNFLNLYEALGFDIKGDGPGRALPTFAHVPHIMNQQGNKKLSKRDGATDVLDYINAGFLPETLVSFIATLGWNDGTEQEIFSKGELIEKFSLERVQRSGARFDEKRLLWMNGQWIRRLEADNLYERVKGRWPKSASSHDDEYKLAVLRLVQDRIKTLNELPMMSRYFFEEPPIDMSLISDNKQLNKLGLDELKKIQEVACSELSKVNDWSADSIQTCLNELLDITQQKPAIVFGLIRILTTWAPFSPQLSDTLALLGRERFLERLSRQL